MGMIADLFVKLGLNSSQYTQGINNATQQTNKFSGMLKSIGSTIAGVFAAGAIINFTKEAINLAGTAEGVRSAFEKLGGMKYLDNMKAATKGTVTELQLMQNTVKASNLGLPIQTLANLFEFATTRAAQTGESVDYLVESIVLGIGRKSPLILDNLGISAIALSEKMGGVAVASASVGQVAEAVGKIAEESLKKMGATATTTAQQMAALNAQWLDIKTNFGKAIIEGGALGGVLDYINQQLWVLASNKSVLNKLDLLIFGGDADKTIKQYMDQEKAVKSYYNALSKFETGFKKPEFQVSTKPLNDAQIYTLQLNDLKKKAEEAKQALRFAKPENVGELSEAFNTANDALQAFLKTAKEVNKEVANIKLVGTIPEITGGKSPFKFGTAKPTSEPTTINTETGLFNVKPTEAPPLDMAGITSSLKGGEELKTALEAEFISPIEQFNIDLNNLIQSGLTDAISSFSEGIGQLLAGDITPAEFGNKILAAIGGFMQQMGTLFIAYAIASKGFATAIGLGPANPLSWGLAMAAGVGLMIAGSAITSLSKKGISGGGSSGGGYTASGYNPSSSNSSASNFLEGKVVFEVRGDTLQGVLNNTDRKNKSIR